MIPELLYKLFPRLQHVCDILQLRQVKPPAFGKFQILEEPAAVV